MRNPGITDSRSGSGGAKTTPCCSKVGIKRGPWTSEEDEILAGYIKREGEGQWRTLPKRAGLLRCGKSCRLRWMNYLRPHLKRGLIAPDEEDLILRLHRLLGNRWSLIAGRIPGRTDNEIKNYWNTHLSKKLISQGLDPRTHKPLETYYIPNPNNNSSSISNHAYDNNNINNNYHVRSSPAQDPNPNPNRDHFPPPLAPPPVILNQEASTSYGNNVAVADGMIMAGYSNRRGEDEGFVDHLDSSNYSDEMFSSFLDLDSLIMNDNNQIIQGQLSSPMMMMKMQQPMGYGSNSQGFDHYGSVWGSDPPLMASGFSNQRDQCNWNLDPKSFEEFASHDIFMSTHQIDFCIFAIDTHVYLSKVMCISQLDHHLFDCALGLQVPP